MTIKILSDLHHFDLFYSLQLLFEKRLGGELYRQIGEDWYAQGFWNIYNHPDTVKQYLSLDQAYVPKDVHGFKLPERWTINKNYRYEDGIYYIVDPTKGKVQRAITLDKFREMEFDIIISSVPQHIGPFNRLIELYQPKAKHIFQVGNAWGHLPGVKNILASTAPFGVPPEINTCFYHQEFDLDVYTRTDPVNQKNIYSFIHYMREPELHQFWKQSLPGYNFVKFGAGGDQDLGSTQLVADKMKEAGWVWHVKPEGDGYGYNIHCAAAVGRPLITKSRYYVGKLGYPLMEDLVTCINLDARSPHDNMRLLDRLSQPEEHKKMCDRMYNRFTQLVNFDAEFERIKKFLENLQ